MATTDVVCQTVPMLLSVRVCRPFAACERTHLGNGTTDVRFTQTGHYPYHRPSPTALTSVFILTPAHQSKIIPRGKDGHGLHARATSWHEAIVRYGECEHPLFLVTITACRLYVPTRLFFRSESSVLLEEPETLDAALLQEEEAEEEAEAKAEAVKVRPGLTMFTDGSRMKDGRSRRLRGGVEERSNLEGHKNPHGLQPGVPRRGVRRSCPLTGIGIKEKLDLGTGHHFLGCSSDH